MKSIRHSLPIAAFTLALSLSGCAGRFGKPPEIATAPAPEPTPVLAINTPRVNALDPVELQTDRYSYLPAKPSAEQLNPLLMIIDVHLPRELRTVEDAAMYLLHRSGYHLSHGPGGHRVSDAILTKNIPDVHRHLGPMTLQDGLITLGGQGYRLLIDPINRVVGYDINPQDQQAGGSPQ
jgi:conjugative transfer region protein (TIGR03748 family)